MLDVVAKHQIAYVLMHMQGTPQNMQLNPSYENVVKDISRFLQIKNSGLPKQRI
jgi:dihydropteroate synthase